MHTNSPDVTRHWFKEKEDFCYLNYNIDRCFHPSRLKLADIVTTSDIVDKVNWSSVRADCAWD